jgi:hypothetical protein
MYWSAAATLSTRSLWVIVVTVMKGQPKKTLIFAPGADATLPGPACGGSGKTCRK